MNSGDQAQEIDYDKAIAEQAAKMEKMAGLQKKKPLIAGKEKKLFDSGEYFKEKEREQKDQGDDQS